MSDLSPSEREAGIHAPLVDIWQAHEIGALRERAERAEDRCRELEREREEFRSSAGNELIALVELKERYKRLEEALREIAPEGEVWDVAEMSTIREIARAALTEQREKPWSMRSPRRANGCGP
jgi:hypothetical protein